MTTKRTKLIDANTHTYVVMGRGIILCNQGHVISGCYIMAI